jgi:hypothetical protein
MSSYTLTESRDLESNDGERRRATMAGRRKFSKRRRTKITTVSVQALD